MLCCKAIIYIMYYNNDLKSPVSETIINILYLNFYFGHYFTSFKFTVIGKSQLFIQAMLSGTRTRPLIIRYIEYVGGLEIKRCIYNYNSKIYLKRD